jgi:hypothetical protein
MDRRVLSAYACLEATGRDYPIHPSSRALSLATRHARSRNSNEVIGASASSMIVVRSADAGAFRYPSECYLVIWARQADDDRAAQRFKL